MKTGTRSGFWIIVVAAAVLELTACIQYFYSRAGLRAEAEMRAASELRKAELEIEKHTIEMEAAAKTLAMLAEKHVNCPDSIFAATRSIVQAIGNTSSVAVAYVPGYFPKKGRYFEACSSRISKDSIYTRQIGSAEHDYTQLEWFRNGLTIDSCWWCEPYLDDSGSQTWVVSCSHPVHGRNGAVVAVVCVDLSLAYLQDMSEYLQIYPESFYSITSGTGEKIVPLPDTVPGRKYHIFEEEIDATGWHISIVIPDEIIYADLRRIGLFVSILMFIGLALLVFILYRSGKSIQQLLTVRGQQEKIEGELEIAQTIQRAMLPTVFPPFLDRLDLNIYGMVRPAKEIGGDLYDFYVRHDKLFFCIGDVSGKGVPAALVMATIRSLFRSITAHEEKADRIMQILNDSLSENNEQLMFVTLFLGVLDLESGELNYCNAGHNAPVIIDGHQAKEESIPVLPNLPLGIEPGFAFTAQAMQLHRDDTLFLYTDGLTEAANKRMELFSENRMMDVLAKVNGLRPQQIVDSIQTEVGRFVDGAEQSDDLTMLVIRYQQSAIVMRNDIQQIPTLAEWIDGLGIPDEYNMPINLALEEIVTNVMLYAYPSSNEGKVFVEFVKAKGEAGERLIFTITDSGIPFDPTQAPEVDTTLSAEDRDIGGLGIHLVRQLMDEIAYERSDNKNILTLVKNIQS
ncbi:MAG: SpoIIE family protein phosphatase [Paludibacteraceae bacterium]|nr:SpoIIE family protein phosphatase [Paludibacteraceae bacterium]